MKLKKIIVTLILAVMLLAQFSFIQFTNFVYAAEEQTNTQLTGNFHYDQLSDTAKKIYAGIVAMRNNGILKTGTENYDLVANGHFTSDEIKSYEDGTINLKKEFQAARYAFYADFPEVFYVSFNKLAIRTTKDADGNYHAYVGAGSNTNYRVDGFEDQAAVETAITEFENKVNEIVAEVNNLQIEEGKNAEAEKIKYVHNKITHMAGYRLETDCTPGYEDFLGTPYGILVKGQGVCEGYARAFKTILDKLNMTCILVQGLHQSEGALPVAHMWNYVALTDTTARTADKKWYAVDTTMDDPYTRKVKVPGEDYTDREPGWDIVQGFENTRYLLVGKMMMAKEHTAVEKVEAAGDYVFEYPELEEEEMGISSVTEVNGLVVKYKQEGNETDEYKAGDYFISYNNMGYRKAIEQGYYILAKYHEYRPGDEVWLEGKWGYFLDDVYAGGFQDRGDYIYLTVPNGEYMEFAVTNLAPGDYANDPTYLSFQGTEDDIIAQTGKLYNPSGTYRAKPYIKTQDPVPTADLSVGRTYHVTIVYDDDLIPVEGEEVGYKFESSGPTGAESAKVENFSFDGKRTITFDFTPSKMFADDGAGYIIYPTGLVGKNSGKEPMEIMYGATNQIACAFSMNKYRNWNLFARPTLMADEDLSLTGWKTEDGESVADELKNRIALVTTKTTIDEKEDMNNLMENKLQQTNQEILKSETYNISLNACKKYVVQTGHRLRLSLGFPAGYGPEDAGVTFKAYHFKKDAKGNVIEVEEIPCVVTQYGLIITCDAFSPFAIAAVNMTEAEKANKTKQLVLSSVANGKIVAVNEADNNALKAAGDILDVNENESKTFRIIPNEGYQIETITVCGKTIEITDKDSMEITVNYDDIKDGNVIVDATYIAKEVAQAEEEKGETVVILKATPAKITMNQTQITTTINEKLTITPTVEQTQGIQTYQWYKDGVKLEGKTNKVLEIENLKVEDTGRYMLKVTTTLETSSEETQSDECNVVVRSFDTTVTAQDTSLNLQDLKPGDEFSVNVAIGNFKNMQKGLYAIEGQLEYDQNVLEVVLENGKILTPANGWDETKENLDNLKFITTGSGTNNEGIKEGTIGTIKLKVKETIQNDIETVFKIKAVAAADGDADIASKDAQLKVKVVVPIPEEDGITSDVYTIDNETNTISKVNADTTVATFKQNVTSHGELVFTDKNGNILTDESVIGTGTTLKVGTTLEYTFIVKGDVDGNGTITLNDLALIKIHLIGKELLTGVYEKAADIDLNGKVSINDVASLKLILIGLE